MHIYFSGIGGAGLGPLAEIAQDAGFDVSGSDLNESLMTHELEGRGVDIVYEQTREAITAEHTVNPIDWLVYTSALADDHPELVFARENGIRISKRDEFLAQFLLDMGLYLIAVAGTHGKTTTTGMLIWAANQLGLPISYSIGTTIPFGPSGKFDKNAKYFVYECDEYDRNFLQFHPKISILPSVDYDHADIFPTRDDYKDAFRDFIDQSNETIMYKNTFDYLQPLRDENILVFDHKPGFDEIGLAGQIRRNNAYLAAQVLKAIDDWDDAKIYAALSGFPGVGRRYEQLTSGLISDYAHHPTEVAATMQMALESNPNVIVVYEPHQNARQVEIADQYRDVFAGAKHIYWLPTYLPPGDRENAKTVLSPADLIAKLSDPTIAEPAEMDDDLWTAIETHIEAGDLVVGMSAGNLDRWLRDHLE